MTSRFRKAIDDNIDELVAEATSEAEANGLARGREQAAEEIDEILSNLEPREGETSEDALLRALHAFQEWCP